MFYFVIYRTLEDDLKLSSDEDDYIQVITYLYVRIYQRSLKSIGAMNI